MPLRCATLGRWQRRSPFYAEGVPQYGVPCETPLGYSLSRLKPKGAPLHGAAKLWNTTAVSLQGATGDIQLATEKLRELLFVRSGFYSIHTIVMCCANRTKKCECVHQAPAGIEQASSKQYSARIGETVSNAKVPMWHDGLQ